MHGRGGVCCVAQQVEVDAQNVTQLLCCVDADPAALSVPAPRSGAQQGTVHTHLSFTGGCFIGGLVVMWLSNSAVDFSTGSWV